MVLGRIATGRLSALAGCVIALALPACGDSQGGDDDGGGQGNEAGSGGSVPNDYVAQLDLMPPTRLDLLLMIDNSLSMSGKQRLLADSIPPLLSRLTSPVCRDAQDRIVGAPPCPPSALPEFRALEDIHIGVITSSLGHHGSNDLCSADEGATKDDRAQLLPSVRAGLSSWNNQGFLAWDPRSGVSDAHVPAAWGAPGGPGNAGSFADALADHVVGVGENGCGYEGSLEAWYRFLIDPEPAGELGNDGNGTLRNATNTLILEQRAAFLRPDSALVILMLTDENDCSINDEAGSRGWLVASQQPFLDGAEDNLNVRCFHQRERFGVDLLYPVKRYVDALTKYQIDPRENGELVENPLFASRLRSTSSVILAGIVGVPWQDLATDGTQSGRPNSLSDPRALAYLTAEELVDSDRWRVILGDPATGLAPSDPHMVESIDPRPAGASHPLGIANAAIVAPGGTGSDSISGHEQAVEPALRDDLQYACIYPIEPLPCTEVNVAGCECNADESARLRPLCEYAAPGMDGTQVFAKAYPSLRILEVLKGVGAQAVVTSICAKNTEGEAASDQYYGYNPAVSALMDRLRSELVWRCLPRPLPMEDDGSIPCNVVEARNVGAGNCACENAGRTPPRAQLSTAISNFLQDESFCGTAATPPCADFCLCEIDQLRGQELLACKTDEAAGGSLGGYCYVDPAASTARYNEDDRIDPYEQQLIDQESAITANCPQNEQRVLRFLGENLPARDALILLACNAATPR